MDIPLGITPEVVHCKGNRLHGNCPGKGREGRRQGGRKERRKERKVGKEGKQ